MFRHRDILALYHINVERDLFRCFSLPLMRWQDTEVLTCVKFTRIHHMATTVAMRWCCHAIKDWISYSNTNTEVSGDFSIIFHVFIWLLFLKVFTWGSMYHSMGQGCLYSCKLRVQNTQEDKKFFSFQYFSFFLHHSRLVKAKTDVFFTNFQVLWRVVVAVMLNVTKEGGEGQTVWQL